MGLRKAALGGVKWTTISVIVITGANLLKISVLARFLDKSDFGLMALVNFVLGFMNLFMDMGLSSAILHKTDISDEEYASLYWINVVFSIIIFIGIFIFSSLVSSFYNEPELQRLIPLMALSIILSASGRQFRTIEQKEFNFRYLAFVDIAGSLSGLFISIILAISGKGVYSLVFGALAHFTISNGILFFNGVYSRGIKFHFSYTEAKPFLKMGIYQVGGQTVNYFNRDLDILLIGKIFGTEILGGYSLAKEFVRKPMLAITPIISKVGMSVFPKIQNDHPSLRRHFIDLFTGLGSLNGVIFGLIAIFAHNLVSLFFGKEFLSIVPYVQLFSFLIYLRSMGNYVSILVITTGRTDYEFYWNIFVTLLMPIAIFAGAHFSIETIIIMLILVQLALLIPGWYLFYHRLIKLEFMPYLRSNLIPLVIFAGILILNKLAFADNIFSKIVSGAILLTGIFVYTYYNLNEFKYLVNKAIPWLPTCHKRTKL
jgi:O-antigen/teichoic acid export membrane protein